MYSKSISLSEIKQVRLERHWSQEQLAEMTGLSVRTIQRIENENKAGLESIKALSAVFEMNILEGDKELDKVQKKKEEQYIQNIKGAYQWGGLALFSIIISLINVIQGDDDDWSALGWISLSWIVFFAIYAISNFDLFGDSWKERILKKKFPDRRCD
jgi:transcriptional regulator with XRE-family HTH domain